MPSVSHPISFPAHRIRRLPRAPPTSRELLPPRKSASSVEHGPVFSVVAHMKRPDICYCMCDVVRVDTRIMMEES